MDKNTKENLKKQIKSEVRDTLSEEKTLILVGSQLKINDEDENTINDDDNEDSIFRKTRTLSAFR